MCSTVIYTQTLTRASTHINQNGSTTQRLIAGSKNESGREYAIKATTPTLLYESNEAEKKIPIACDVVYNKLSRHMLSRDISRTYSFSAQKKYIYS